jgi:hypothetical protein
LAVLAVSLILLAGCAAAPPPEGALSSYDGMTKSKAMRTRASVKADETALVAAKTLRLEPVAFAAATEGKATPAQLALIANAMQRTLCARLSARFEIVGPQGPADLTVKTTVTRIKPTGTGAAGVSIVAAHFSPIPFTPSRVPLGLGGFSAEGEATDLAGRQDAAMTWSRDADIYTDSRVSAIGDAYNFSGAFARDLSALLITGKDPVHDLALPTAPHHGKSARIACAGYGKGGGLAGFIGSRLGAPPEWTDGKRPPSAQVN